MSEVQQITIPMGLFNILLVDHSQKESIENFILVEVERSEEKYRGQDFKDLLKALALILKIKLPKEKEKSEIEPIPESNTDDPTPF